MRHEKFVPLTDFLPDRSARSAPSSNSPMIVLDAPLGIM